MKITKNTKAHWLASETTTGIKVWFVAKKGIEDRAKSQIGDYKTPILFESIEEVKKFCKGEIIFTKRKVTMSKATVVSK